MTCPLVTTHPSGWMMDPLPIQVKGAGDAVTGAPPPQRTWPAAPTATPIITTAGRARNAATVSTVTAAAAGDAPSATSTTASQARVPPGVLPDRSQIMDRPLALLASGRHLGVPPPDGDRAGHLLLESSLQVGLVHGLAQGFLRIHLAIPHEAGQRIVEELIPQRLPGLHRC